MDITLVAVLAAAIVIIVIFVMCFLQNFRERSFEEVRVSPRVGKRILWKFLCYVSVTDVIFCSEIYF